MVWSHQTKEAPPPRSSLGSTHIYRYALPEQLSAWYHGVMSKNLTVRLDDELAADTEALARAEGQSLNETVKIALREAVERRQKDPAFRRRVRQIIDDDRELLERLAK